MSKGDFQNQKAWVAFSGKTDLPWLRRFLKPGFCHCFVMIRCEGGWLSYDPLANHTEILFHPIPFEFDVDQWLKSQGMRVLPVTLCRTHKRPAPLMFFTCVEAVKRLIGLHAWHVITPWQLYRHLLSQKKGELSWDH